MTIDQLIEILLAAKAGKVIQGREPGHNWSDILPLNEPIEMRWFNWRELRLKPVAVEPGDLTWEEAEELRQQGVPLDLWMSDSHRWENRVNSECPCSKDCSYRRTPPEPKPEPVPPGDLTWEDARSLAMNGVKVDVFHWSLQPGWNQVYYWFLCANEKEQREAAYRRTPPEPKPAPAPAMCECGHPVESHRAVGCLARGDYTNSVFCPCKRSSESFTKPAPEMVPLGPTDYNAGDRVRDVGFTDGWAAVIGVLSTVGWAGVILGGVETNAHFSFEEMRDKEISHDAGATWQRCEKEAKEAP